MVAILAAGLFLTHASPGSKTEALARQALAWGKAVWALDSAANAHLFALGVAPFSLPLLLDPEKAATHNAYRDAERGLIR